VQGLRYLAESGLHPQVIMSLHIGNVDEIEALVQLAESSGAGSVKFNLIQPTGRGEALEKHGRILELEQQLRVGHWVENILQKQVSIRLVYSWPMAFHSLGRLTKGGLDVCGVFGILGILHSGHLALCGIGEHVPELCYGLLGHDHVEEVWVSNPALLNLRESFFKNSEGICARCLFQNRCMGHCVAETYMRTKRLTAPYEFCQTAAQNGYFPISRLRALDKK
jgi:SynChlorMet cassette radical SAM/SPASM protein ScmF